MGGVLPNVFAIIGIPILALILVAVIDWQSGAPMTHQFASWGTDLCILAIGSSGSVLINPHLESRFGFTVTMLIGIGTVLLNVIFAGISVRVRRNDNISDRWKARTSFPLGLAAVALVSAIIFVS